MPAREKFHEIVEKVKRTFDLLREIFAETPPEPGDRQIAAAAAAAVEPQPPAAVVIVESVPRSAPLSTPPALKPASKPKKQAAPAAAVIPLTDVHQRYLTAVLDATGSIDFPGMGVDGNSLSIPVEQAFVPLLLRDRRIGVIRPERDDGPYGAAAPLSLQGALQRYRRMLLVGPSGSGKTTLLQIMMFAYSRAMLAGLPVGASAPGSKQRLLTAEDGHFPILISLRGMAGYLQKHASKTSRDSLARLLNYFAEIPGEFPSELYPLPEHFVEAYLSAGRALILFDGLDEVDHPRLRQRVLQLIEKCIRQYPACRYVISSRSLGAEAEILSAHDFGTLELGEFTPADMRKYNRGVALAIETRRKAAAAEPQAAQALAKQQADQLIGLIEGNLALAELATHPQILNLLMLVQRDREQLPLNRLDLVETGLQILFDLRLANLWTSKKPDELRLAQAEARHALQMLAFWLHQNNQADFDPAEFAPSLQKWYLSRRNGEDARAAEAVRDFHPLLEIAVESGLLTVRKSGRFHFSQRVFQELLAAHALADREDTLAFTLKCLPSKWWREVILFKAGILNRQSKHRVTELIQFILENGVQAGLQPYESSFLAFECLGQVDPKSWEPVLLDDFKKIFRRMANLPVQKYGHQELMNKIAASQALIRLPGGQILGQYWKLPVGEPEWVKIPAGPFWMGETDPVNPSLHQVVLPEFHISRVPVTNSQYALYLADTGLERPEHWRAGQVTGGRENHPVVNVNWHEAMGYCNWLSEKIKHTVCLPSEAEWEKAARGVNDQREYPWGAWEDLRANTSEVAIGDTTLVGLFSAGASPFGLLDMTGNVREWTRSLADFGYPYDPQDRARENLQAPDGQARILRGGSFYYTREFARCTTRQRYYPDFRFYNFGFRVVISPLAVI